MMDLQALRAKAFEARKRKRAQDMPEDGQDLQSNQRIRRDAVPDGQSAPSAVAMDPADFEEGEISEESDDESEAVAAMIIAPRLQIKGSASPLQRFTTSPIDHTIGTIRHLEQDLPATSGTTVYPPPITSAAPASSNHTQLQEPYLAAIQSHNTPGMRACLSNDRRRTYESV